MIVYATSEEYENLFRKAAGPPLRDRVVEESTSLLNLLLQPKTI